MFHRLQALCGDIEGKTTVNTLRKHLVIERPRFAGLLPAMANVPESP